MMHERHVLRRWRQSSANETCLNFDVDVLKQVFFYKFICRCIVEGESVEQLVDVTDMRDEDSTYYCNEFYPGQQVQGIARVFKDAKWITGTKPAINNHGRLKAIVEEVFCHTNF